MAFIRTVYTVAASLLLASMLSVDGFHIATPMHRAASISDLQASTSCCSPSQPQMNMRNIFRRHKIAKRKREEEKQQKAPRLDQSAPQRIGLFVEPTPFTHVSGYSNRFKEMLKFLKKAGDEVSIVTTDDVKDAPTKHLGYEIQNTKGFRFPLYNQIVLTFDLELKGMQMIRKLKPDVIHCTSPGFITFAALIYARMFRIPLLMSYHTHLPIYARDYLWFLPGSVHWAWAMLRLVHNRADLTLVTSPQMKEELTEHGVQRVEVWRKGIDTEVFDPKYKSQTMREKLSAGHPEDPLMIYVGRLGTEKKLELLKDVLHKIPNARLAIVGKGPAQEKLKEHFKGTKTVFTGIMHGKELSEAFASADVFVMPSDSETLGFVVLESMASGVPVVGAEAGGIPSIIHDGVDGYLAEPGNADSFTEKVKNLLDNREHRVEMGKAARTEAEQWGWEAATSVLRNVQYKKAMQNFRYRALNGFGLPHTRSKIRLLNMQISRIVRFVLRKKPNGGTLTKA